MDDIINTLDLLDIEDDSSIAYGEWCRKVVTEDGYYHVLYSNPTIKHGLAYSSKTIEIYRQGQLERKITHSPEYSIHEVYFNGRFIQKITHHSDGTILFE